MPEPCRVAVVGAGYTAGEHLRAFADVPGVEIAGLFSRTRAKAEALANHHPGAIVCDSVSELYERTRAHLVVVTVTELSMRAVAAACFEFPWTVLLEKPAGCDLDDARAIHASAKERNRRVYVGFNRRCMSATIGCKDAIERSTGARFIKVQDQEDPKRALEVGQPKAVVDRWMFANSIHLIDYFLNFGRGPVVDVNPIVPWRPEEPGIVLVELKFESGDIGLYEGIWHGPGPWAVSVTVPGRRWEMRPVEQAVTQASRGKPEPVETHEWDKTFKPGFRLQAEFAAAAATGGDPGRLATLDDSLEAMTLIDRMFFPDRP